MCFGALSARTCVGSVGVVGFASEVSERSVPHVGGPDFVQDPFFPKVYFNKTFWKHLLQKSFHSLLFDFYVFGCMPVPNISHNGSSQRLGSRKRSGSDVKSNEFQHDGLNTSQNDWYSAFLATLLVVAGCPPGTVHGSDNENNRCIDLHNVSTIDVDSGSAKHEPSFRPSNCCFSFSKRVLQWLVDSGATIHVVDDISCLSRITSRDCSASLRVANGQNCKVLAIGEVDLELRDGDTGQTRTIVLKNVHVAPGIDTCVISTRKLWRDNRIRTKFGRFNTLKTLDGFRYYMRDAPNGHYYAEPTSAPSLQAISSDIIHARLGHCGEKRTRLAASRTT